MKKSFKGFTLIECIVALAILGIASLTMAQIYAGVAKRNRENHVVNTSLSNQMAYVEKYTNTEAVPIYYNNSTSADPNASNTDRKPPHESGSGGLKDNYVKIVKVDTDGKTLIDDETYSFPVDTFVLKSRDGSDTAYSSDENYNLRYKYIIGHSN
ncbi:MAG: type II secretion system protein [Oscillospiraceae bacterium]